MHNGGGPACLRLRVVLTDRELERVKPGVLFNESLYAALKSWIEKHYRDRLTPADLGDVKLLNESRNALDDLTKILGLGSIYRFQGALSKCGNLIMNRPAPRVKDKKKVRNQLWQCR